MRAREFEHFIAKEAGLLPSEVDHRMRPLRESGLIPMGGRGPHAPNIECVHVGLMLLNLVSRRAADAFEVGEHAASLLIQKREDGRPFLGRKSGGPIDLHSVLTHLLEDEGSAKVCRRLEIECGGQQALCIEYGAAGTYQYEFRRRLSSKPKTIGQWLVLEGSFFEKAGALLRRRS